MNDLNKSKTILLFGELNNNLENEKEILKEIFESFESFEYFKQIIIENINKIEFSKECFQKINNSPFINSEFKYKNNFLEELEVQKQIYKKMNLYLENMNLYLKNIKAMINLLIVSKNKEQKYMEELKEFVIKSN